MKKKKLKIFTCTRNNYHIVINVHGKYITYYNLLIELCLVLRLSSCAHFQFYPFKLQSSYFHTSPMHPLVDPVRMFNLFSFEPEPLPIIVVGSPGKPRLSSCILLWSSVRVAHANILFHSLIGIALGQSVRSRFGTDTSEAWSMGT